MGESNKNKTSKYLIPEDAQGFQDFIDSEKDKSFLLKKGNTGTVKNDRGFEYFTFLNNDATKLVKTRILLNEKLPFTLKFDQTPKLIERQKEELLELREKLFKISDEKNSPYRKSLSEIFDAYFETKK